MEILERQYGGLRATKAAIIIQRAYRQYALKKKFISYRTAANGGKKRLSQRFENIQFPVGADGVPVPEIWRDSGNNNYAKHSMDQTDAELAVKNIWATSYKELQERYEPGSCSRQVKDHSMTEQRRDCSSDRTSGSVSQGVQSPNYTKDYSYLNDSLHGCTAKLRQMKLTSTPNNSEHIDMSAYHTPRGSPHVCWTPPIPRHSYESPDGGPSMYHTPRESLSTADSGISLVSILQNTNIKPKRIFLYIFSNFESIFGIICQDFLFKELY